MTVPEQAVEAAPMSKAEQQVRARLANNGRNPANNNAGIRVGRDLHLCEMLLGELDAARAKVAALPLMGVQQTDAETIQTLLDLLNPLHGSLDEQTYDEKYKAGFDAPGDTEYAVNVTAQQERDICQAVLILEDRKRSALPGSVQCREDVARTGWKYVYAKRWRTLIHVPESITDEVRDALAAKPAGQPVEGMSPDAARMEFIDRVTGTSSQTDLAERLFNVANRNDNFNDEDTLVARALLKEAALALSPAPASPQPREGEKS